MLPLLGSPYNIGQGFAVNADGSVVLAKQVPATSNYGLLSIGTGPWDGTSPGHFTGNVSGTALAVNVPGAFAGNLIDIKKGNTSRLILDSNGVLSGPIVGVFNELEVGFLLALNSDRNGVILPLRGQINQTGDYLQTQDNNIVVLSGIRSDGLIYSTKNGLATKEKAGAPIDADWATAPPDGTIIGDSTNNKIWIRLGGVWKGVAVA